MAKINTARKATPVGHTHEGAAVYHAPPNALAALRRGVSSCLLWEKEFYEDGVAIAERLKVLAAAVDPADLAELCIEVRSKMNLRHVPLFLLLALLKTGKGVPGLVSNTIAATIQRADELAELLAMYWAENGKDAPLAGQLKKGLAKAFQKFNAYGLAKYNRENAVKLRDVLFLSHAKPRDEEQAVLWKALVDGTLQAPDTWEVALSAGADKKATWERLITEGKLGYLALLRNLRNMASAGIDTTLIRDAIVARKGGAERVLPFRYIAAARACPQLEPALDQALVASIADLPALPGITAVLVDVSQSMSSKLSAKSDLTRMDAAAALASIINGQVRMFSFSNQVVEVPPRRGMAGVDAIMKSQQHAGTALFDAVHLVQTKVPHDRLIVITDEQAAGGGYFGGNIHGALMKMPAPRCNNGYVINVASAKNGVGYGPWNQIDGFSENVIRWMVENEASRAR